MEHLLHLLVQRGLLGADHYWHLRLLGALLPGPLAGVLCLLFFGKRAPCPPRAAPRLWVRRDGRLVARR